MSNNVGVGVG